MNYQVIFFPDPYDVGIREVQRAATIDDLENLVVSRLQHSDFCAFVLYEKCGNGWKSLPRQCYYEINKKLGRCKQWKE